MPAWDRHAGPKNPRRGFENRQRPGRSSDNADPASPSEFEDGPNRDYDFGPGLGFSLGGALSRAGHQFLRLSYGGQLIHNVNGLAGNGAELIELGYLEAPGEDTLRDIARARTEQKFNLACSCADGAASCPSPPA